MTTPVRSVSLTIKQGERVAVVGESGCGKSLTALALTQLSPTDRALLEGQIWFDGTEMLSLDPATCTRIRGNGIAYVFQDPTASLNPVMRVQDQIAECLPGMGRKQRHARIIELLTQTGLPDPVRAAKAYPCELSGGQLQRIMLAMALASKPKLLIADEPTTALDVTTQRQVLDLIDTLATTYDMAVLLITHNLGIVAGRMSRMYVMYAGQIVETGAVADVLAMPYHPYTRGLLGAVPLLDTPRDKPLQDIPGTVPSPNAWPQGCAFAPRCADARSCCTLTPPPDREQPQRRCRCWLEKFSCC